MNKTATQIVKLNPTDFGLNETKAKQIEKMFAPMLEKMTALEEEYNKITNLEVNQETCLKAKALRLQYRDIRTATAKIHKELKSFYLNGGRFVDGWKNAQLFASQGIEDKLSGIENHFEIIEAERIKKLQNQRAAELMKYEADFVPGNLGDMDPDVWNNFIFGVKAGFEARKAAEKQAEADRIAKEKAEAEERERIRLDNIRLQEEAEAAETQRQKEAVERQRIETARIAKDQKATRAREAKFKKIRIENEAKLQKEREAREKIEKQLEDKRNQEAAADLARQKAEKDASLAPDKKKLEVLAEDINRIKLAIIPEVSNKEAEAITAEVVARLESIRQYIFKQSESL